MRLSFLLMVGLVLTACVHSPERYVEPFGDMLRCEDGECVHFANQYCQARGQAMEPISQNGGWLDSVLMFRCVGKD